MKYEFIKVDEDTTKLKYKDKEFDIKRDIDMQAKIQSSIPKAKLLMAKDLTAMGMTKKDLVIETHEGSKTYYDNSNVIELEEQYQAIASQEIYDDLMKKYCGMSLTELMLDINLDIQNKAECEKFGFELTTALTGKNFKSPS